MSSRFPEDAEWLEADGLGGFASGTVCGIRTRRYHALLLTATTPPTGRMVLVNGLEAWVETSAGTFALSAQRYTPDVVHPDGAKHVESFAYEPWPRWVFVLPDGTRIAQEIVARHGAGLVGLRWQLLGDPGGNGVAPARVALSVRLLLSGRDYHALHHENPAFRFAPEIRDERITWQPYDGVPAVTVLTNGRYDHAPEWYRNFLYSEERARGLDHLEDLASPGSLEWNLAAVPAVCVLGTDPGADPTDAVEAFTSLRAAEEERRRGFPSPLQRAADAYLVRRSDGLTIIAGYPWFTDWGRDTFIALRGLCLATGRIDAARRILLAWGETVSEGMLPNRFPDQGGAPEYNAVDASLWYVIAAGDLRRAMAARGLAPSPREERLLDAAIEAIISGYAGGTRYGIHLDDDGLLAAGTPGVQLTWMDAKVGDWVVTPRIGKPVEVQALWLGALRIASAASARWTALLTRGTKSFGGRFWNEAGGCLYDVVDVDHVAGRVDAAFRPNQIFAVGGLPTALLDPSRARRVVDAVEARLWTPLGLRSLAPGESGYAPHYEGDMRTRDGAYHQGTVWPWLLAPFVEAWLRVHGGTPRARAEARRRFLSPVLAHLETAGLGHVSEIADADPPHTPRGCPFQAWSVAALLRLEEVLELDDRPAPGVAAKKTAGAWSAPAV